MFCSRSKLYVCFQMVLVVLLLFSVNSAAQTLDVFKGEKGEIKISGGTAHIPVMKEAATKIMTLNPNIRISIAGGGSGVGIKQVGEGLVDIGNSGRTPTSEEVNKYGLKMFQWAIDGVAVIVHKGSPVKNLKKTDLIRIFSGEISNWKELGGPDKPISIYTRDEASGTREVFWEKGLDKGAISPKAKVVVSNGAMKSAVATDPNSIGYTSVGHVDSSVAPIALDGVMASIDNVKNGSYKISRGLYSNTKGEPKSLTKKFIDYLYTPEGQKIITEEGFIPVK
ncbi:MAG TPA: phosphate ABC transporter substrate-binding protein [Syntrophorhabdaceae bacterium]|nr:phosphate ABC transporter substrate-binding protein [Syntrophorhabdaceae bacterium]